MGRQARLRPLLRCHTVGWGFGRLWFGRATGGTIAVGDMRLIFPTSLKPFDQRETHGLSVGPVCSSVGPAVVTSPTKTIADRASASGRRRRDALS